MIRVGVFVGWVGLSWESMVSSMSLMQQLGWGLSVLMEMISNNHIRYIYVCSDAA